MSEIYNEEYYHSYCGSISYEEPEHWVRFFGNIADRIVQDLNPETVLDAGCAMGYLVAALRDRGVKAFGVDISEYAISKVREDVKPYCAVGSLTEPLPDCLPEKYDLVVTIEVLEHLYEDEGKKAISNLCKYADKVIFSSTPDNFEEQTHINVQQREYWAKLFAEQGFFDDINYRPDYITAYAACYRKSGDVVRLVEDYERNIRMTEAQNEKSRRELEKAVEDKERHIVNITAMLEENKKEIEELTGEIHSIELKIQDIDGQFAESQELYNDFCIKAEAQLNEKEEHIRKLHQKLDYFKAHYYAAIEQREDLRRRLDCVQAKYDAISTAAFWRITKPLRKAMDTAKKILKSNRYTHLMCKGLKCLAQNGVGYTLTKVKWKLRTKRESKKAKTLYTREELDAQRRVKFDRDIKFSILVPLYNTPEKFLREMIDSVRNQTYQNWELCMADGSDEKYDYVQKICSEYEKKDKRVRYKRLEKNLGISGNTNACIEMADGDYISLFDHDDLLHPAVLYENMRAICEQGADFIYTDENTFHNTPKDAFCPHFKPDFSPDTLRSYNYICHFVSFDRMLLEKTGGFRCEFDGSQDYDMILRLTEQAQKIVHIPKILYYWRAHKNSVASDISAKPYAVEAAKKALNEHLERTGLKGTAIDSSIISTYKINYEIEGEPLVSILIPNMNQADTLKKCIDSIAQKSTYQNYEIIIIENNSTDQRIFDYYEKLKENPKVRIVKWEGKFNYSAINNYGAKFAKGEYLLLLNNDVKVITPGWLSEMLMFAQRKDVGAVGAMLYYPDDTIQHAGVILGIGGVGGHSHKYFKRRSYGYMSRLTIAQNLSAVTAACLMTSKKVFEEIGGLDESFEVAFNDVDLCMRIREAGYLIVFTPYAELYHYESKSRGAENTPQKQKRFSNEVLRFQARWGDELEAGDPYYNPNLTLEREDFSII